MGATTSFLKHRLSIFSQRTILGEQRSDTQPLIPITATYKRAEPALTVHVHPSVRLPGLLLERLTSATSQGRRREREKDLLHICSRILDIFNPGIKVIRTLL